MSIPDPRSPLVSWEDYLAAEDDSEEKHEFLAGIVYARPGDTQRHSGISGNILAALHAQLRGHACRPFGPDMLLRIEQGNDLRFYYPDVSIICRRSGPEARFQSEPSVIFEVVSESTSRIDTGEKRMAYLTILALEAYVLVDSTSRAVTVWRRHEGNWTPENCATAGTVLRFSGAGCELSIDEIYEGTGL